MRIAHILPPRIIDGSIVPLMDQYSLLLPSLMGERNYRNVYREQPGFKIMDNGIAEGDRADFQHLLYCARILGCQELVLPDVMGDMDETLRIVARTFYEAFEHREFDFMFVTQGRTMLEMIHCAQRAMNLFPGIVNSIGIPRHIIGREGVIDARLRIAERVRHSYPNVEIHLLGTHPDYPHELFMLRNNFHILRVRGIDTSLAWNATRAKIRLSDPTSLSYNSSVPRQAIKDFAVAEHVDMKLLRDNMEVLNRWAS